VVTGADDVSERHGAGAGHTGAGPPCTHPVSLAAASFSTPSRSTRRKSNVGSELTRYQNSSHTIPGGTVTSASLVWLSAMTPDRSDHAPVCADVEVRAQGALPALPMVTDVQGGVFEVLSDPRGAAGGDAGGELGLARSIRRVSEKARSL
jgi:hypothetical protein